MEVLSLSHQVFVFPPCWGILNDFPSFLMKYLLFLRRFVLTTWQTFDWNFLGQRHTSVSHKKLWIPWRRHGLQHHISFIVKRRKLDYKSNKKNICVLFGTCSLFCEEKIDVRTCRYSLCNKENLKITKVSVLVVVTSIVHHHRHSSRC